MGRVLITLNLNENCDFQVIVNSKRRLLNLLRARHFIFNLKRFDSQVDAVEEKKFAG